jgi:nicotinamidase-related amidase
MDANVTVLLVVDMQNGFLNPNSVSVIAPVQRLITEARRRGIATVFTRFSNREGSQYERLIGWTRLRTSPETDITDELDVGGATVIAKEQYSAFTPEFCALVENKRWQRLLICGVATDGCVLKTAVDAFERGMVPIVVADACASHAGAQVHDAGLLLIGRFIGRSQVMSTDAVVSSLGSWCGVRS